MAANSPFNTGEGKTIGRGLMIVYMNTGSSTVPEWSPLGKRVEDASIEYDWQKEDKKDILDNTYSTMKDPILTTTLDPWNLEGGDKAQEKIWQLGVHDHDAQALCKQDLLIVHFYAGQEASTTAFAERYPESAIEPNRLGGSGGGNLETGINVTFGGKRSVGKAATADGVVTFTPDAVA